MEEAIIRKQLIPVAQDTFLLSSAHKAAYVLEMLGLKQFAYNDRLLTKLFAKGKTALYWTPQPLLIRAFRRVHILHCMPSASPLASYMQIFGVQVFIATGGQTENRRLASLLHVVQDEKFNQRGEDASAYTTRWYAQQKSALDSVYKDMRNVLLQAEHGSEKSGAVAYALPNEIMKSLDDSAVRPVFRGRGFPAIPSADGDAYAMARVLCYCANTRFPIASANYFRGNRVAFDQDAYALCHMLRWLSCSAVRNGEPVTVYVPSKRMRGLLEDWITEQKESGGENAHKSGESFDRSETDHNDAAAGEVEPEHHP
jgi:hypothetical protein